MDVLGTTERARIEAAGGVLVVDRADEEGLRACVATGSDRGPFVRLGYSSRAEHLGCLYISAKFGARIARAIGWTPVDEADELRDRLAAQAAEIAQLREQLAGAGVEAEKVSLAEEMGGGIATVVGAVQRWLELTKMSPADDPAEADALGGA